MAAPVVAAAALLGGIAAFTIGLSTGSEALALLLVVALPSLAALGYLWRAVAWWKIAIVVAFGIAAAIGVLYWAGSGYST